MTTERRENGWDEAWNEGFAAGRAAGIAAVVDAQGGQTFTPEQIAAATPPPERLATACWACGHPSHGSGDRGSGCGECFCTQTEDIGGRPLAQERPAINVERLAQTGVNVWGWDISRARQYAETFAVEYDRLGSE